MLAMILKMSAATFLYILATTLLWKAYGQRERTAPVTILIGLIYGGFAIISTHVGVDYGHMMLNVRDIGPLAAGLFFSPVSGIIAGLVGGIERYIAGTYFGIGSYTRIACSISTCLAGFLAAAFHHGAFMRKKPSPIHAFFMGAVAEVFHMYVVFITHHDDMTMAYYVVRNCAPGMIIFTGLGLGISSSVIRVMSRETVLEKFSREGSKRRAIEKDKISVSQKIQFWLFVVTAVILISNYSFAYVMQTQASVQSARELLSTTAGDISQTFQTLSESWSGIKELVQNNSAMQAEEIAARIEGAGGAEAMDDGSIDGASEGADGRLEARDDGSIEGASEVVDEAFLKRLCREYDLKAVTIVGRDGKAIVSAGKVPVYASLLSEVLDGSVKTKVVMPTDVYVAAASACGDGMVQIVVDMNHVSRKLQLSGLDDAMSFFHVGAEGSFDLFSSSTGIIRLGSHKGKTLSRAELKQNAKHLGKDPYYEAVIFGEKSLCYTEKMSDRLTLLLTIPQKEVYKSRDENGYESILADILLFTVIFMFSSLLVQRVVIQNLDRVNASLARITSGDLNEVVSVRSSYEFAFLSDDINQTVDALKGYIAAAEKRIEQELEFAHTIQESSLPKDFNIFNDRIEVYATMDPAKEVGGDFYDFFRIDEHTVALVVADVSGKGIPAALFMMRSRTYIRTLAERGYAPSEIFHRANIALHEGNDAQMFVTAWIGILDLNTGIMKCANAGHEYPVLQRAGGEYKLFRDRHTLALAALEETVFLDYEISLKAGDKLFMYTDGITEAMNDNYDPYGTERLVAMLNTVKDRSVAETLPAVREDIRAFVGEADQFDDITMLGICLK